MNEKQLKKKFINDPFFMPKTKMHSTVADKGKLVTQVITMLGGYKKTFSDGANRQGIIY